MKDESYFLAPLLLNKLTTFLCLINSAKTYLILYLTWFHRKSEINTIPIERAVSPFFVLELMLQFLFRRKVKAAV